MLAVLRSPGAGGRLVNAWWLALAAGMAPRRRCRTGSFAGINKDFSETLFSPHGAFNGRAVNLAIAASVQYLKDFRALNADEARTKKVFNVP